MEKQRIYAAIAAGLMALALAGCVVEPRRDYPGQDYRRPPPPEYHPDYRPAPPPRY